MTEIEIGMRGVQNQNRRDELGYPWPVTTDGSSFRIQCDGEEKVAGYAYRLVILEKMRV
ncbi:MAG: hypothetical protein ACLSAC_06260 [Enterocloster bolteae]